MWPAAALLRLVCGSGCADAVPARNVRMAAGMARPMNMEGLIRTSWEWLPTTLDGSIDVRIPASGRSRRAKRDNNGAAALAAFVEALCGACRAFVQAVVRLERWPDKPVGGRSAPGEGRGIARQHALAGDYAGACERIARGVVLAQYAIDEGLY